MYARRTIDTSVRLDTAPPPAIRSIEDSDADPIAAKDPVMREELAEPYLLGPELCDAVNVAITLGRPLLVQGDPGVGKTRLAAAVAYRLGLPLEQAHIKSTSRGQDLLYTFDAVRRLSDAQLSGLLRRELPGAEHYVRLGPLGRAIARAAHGRRSVVLLDEVDKADLDFPNDLLRELDELRFDVAEVGGLSYAVPADRPELRPIIIVTNNEEKALPGAFLRRCVFHYMEFPAERSQLDAILQMHGVDDPALRGASLAVLDRLRAMDLTRKPGLSELLDWVESLRSTGIDPAELRRLPHVGALLKQRDDQRVARDRLGAP